MEEINILDLNINLGSIVRDTAATKKSIDELTKSIKDLKNAEEDNTEEIIKQEAALKNLQRDYRTNTKLIQDLTKASAQNVSTVEEGRRALSAVSTLWAQQAKLYGENNEEVQKLAEQKLALTNRLKELEAQTGDNRRNVGNYTQSIREAIGSVGNFGQSSLKLFDVLKANPFILIIDLVVKLSREVGKAQGIVDAFQRVWQPLLAIFQRFVGIIQDAVLPVINSLSNGTKSFGDVLKDLGQAIVDNIINRFQAFKVLAEGVSLLFQGDFKNAIKTFADGVIQLGTGIEGATDKFGKLANEASKAAGVGTQIAALQREIETLNISIETSEAKTRARIDQLRNLAKQEGITAAEGIKALQEASALEEKIEAERDKVVALRLQQAKLKASLNDTDRAAQLEIAKIEAERDKNASARLSRQRELIEATKSLTNRQRAEEKARADEQKKLNQQELDEAARVAEERIKIFELANKSRIKDGVVLTSELIAQEVAREAELLKLREDFFRKQLAAGKVTDVEFKALLAGLNQQFDEFVSGLSAKGAEQAIQTLSDVVTNTRRKLLKTGGILLTPESAQQEIELLQQLAKDEEDVLTARFENGLIRESEFLLQRDELRLRSLEAQARVEAQFLNEQQQRAATNFTNQLEILKLQGESELEIKKLQLQQQQDAEVAAAEKTGSDIALINDKYRLLNEELDKQAVNTRIQLAANYLSSFSQLVGEQTAFGKLAASAAALINTYQAITEALKAPTLPQKIAGVAFATATGFAAVANINKTKTPTAPPKTNIPKLAKGGEAGGNLHSQGGTKYYGEDGNVVELERGEKWYVLNRAASAAISKMGAFNQMFGGRAWDDRPASRLQDGGLARAITQNTVDTRPIVVDVKDIISETARRVELVDSATL